MGIFWTMCLQVRWLFQDIIPHQSWLIPLHNNGSSGIFSLLKRKRKQIIPLYYTLKRKHGILTFLILAAPFQQCISLQNTVPACYPSLVMLVLHICTSLKIASFHPTDNGVFITNSYFTTSKLKRNIENICCHYCFFSCHCVIIYLHQGQ